MKTKIHTVYKTQDGLRVPSTTTVLSILSKPALINWAWEQGKLGLDYKAVRDQAGDIGTLAHYLILCEIQGIEPDTSEYSKQNIDKAETCMIKFLDWQKQNPFKAMFVETPLVSETYKYGGTIDCFAQRGEELILIDFKTGKAIYSDQFIQLASYKNLLQEAGHKFDKTMILRIGKNEEEGFEVREGGDLTKHFEIFKHCLAIYQLQKK